MQKVGDDERVKVTRNELPQLFRGCRAPSLLLIFESGLYKLIMRSNKPEAAQFQDWVTKVVLPAIRKDGAYIEGEEKLASGELSEDVKQTDLLLRNSFTINRLFGNLCQSFTGVEIFD